MAYNNLNATQSTPENVGQKFAPKEKLGRVIKLALTTKDFQFDTQTLAEDQSEWLKAIKQVSNRVRVLPYILENEDQSEEMKKQEFTGGDAIVISEGKTAELFKMQLSVADYRKLRTYNNKEFRVIEIDSEGNLRGTSPDDVVFKGYEATEIYVGKLSRTIGDSVPLVSVYIKYKEPSEISDDLVVLQPRELSEDAWDPRDLDGLTDVELSLVSATTTKIVVKATAYQKGELLAGFDTAGDFLVKNTTGVTQTITITDNNDGTYDLVGTAFANNFTVELGASADISMDGYEGINTVTVTGVA